MKTSFYLPVVLHPPYSWVEGKALPISLNTHQAVFHNVLILDMIGCPQLKQFWLFLESLNAVLYHSFLVESAVVLGVVNIGGFDETQAQVYCSDLSLSLACCQQRDIWIFFHDFDQLGIHDTVIDKHHSFQRGLVVLEKGGKGGFEHIVAPTTCEKDSRHTMRKLVFFKNDLRLSPGKESHCEKYRQDYSHNGKHSGKIDVLVLDSELLSSVVTHC